jgi:hypothetical protein
MVLLFVFGSRILYVFCGACSVREILGFLRMWRLRLGLFVEMCLICYICGCRRIARVVCRLLIFYFHVRLFPLIMGSFYTSCVLGLGPFALFNELLLIKKKTMKLYKSCTCHCLREGPSCKKPCHDCHSPTSDRAYH